MVDANVWVDSFCVDHAESLAARAFIGQATETGALLFFPVHIAKDVLYVVQHELKRSVLASGGALDEASARAIGDAALAFVRNMTENATAVGADASDLWLADKYLALHRDYEDNLVLAACKRAQVDYLVTNDRKLLEPPAFVPQPYSDLHGLAAWMCYDGVLAEFGSEPLQQNFTKAFQA